MENMLEVFINTNSNALVPPGYYSITEKDGRYYARSGPLSETRAHITAAELNAYYGQDVETMSARVDEPSRLR